MFNIECYLHINIKFHLCSQDVLTVRRLKHIPRRKHAGGGKERRDEKRKQQDYYQMGPGRRRYKYNSEKAEAFFHDDRRSLRLQMKNLEKQAATIALPTLDPTTYAEMWALISDRSMAVDPEKLSAFLSDLGLSRADELGYCDSAMWEDLAAHLKPIPKRGLLHILATNKITVGK